VGQTGSGCEPLVREEVIRAVERERPARIPLVRAKWWGEGLEEQYGDRLLELERYPEDVSWAMIDNPADPERMELSWTWSTDGSLDSPCVIDEWSKLDEFIAKLPGPEENHELARMIEEADAGPPENSYRLFGWWRLFFEKPWAIRGMENLMIDYYTAPDRVHDLHGALCDLYCRYIRYASRAMRLDGFWTSDDLGHQRGPMMSPEIFHSFLFPYYRRIKETLNECGLHFWLHSCGDNTLLLSDLVDAGVDVFHPVQKHTMDEREVADQFGQRITFLAGIDVQHALQEKDPEGVREEVRFLIDTFDRPEGGMCIAAGNGIVAGTPFENIEAFLDEALSYGIHHRERYARP
jgi:uroporphyrinogen decarboxylase